jgi:metal-responsive CopG/Arc/MetJ family transcriptional regulator
VKEKPEMRQINLKLTVRQHDDLDKLAEAMGGLSRSNMIRIAIAEYINNHESLIRLLKNSEK